MLIFKKYITELNSKLVKSRLAKSQDYKFSDLDSYTEAAIIGSEKSIDVNESIGIDEMEIDKLYKCL